MTEHDTGKSAARTQTLRVPSAGIALPEEAVAAVKEASSQLYDFLGVPGRASTPGPGIRACAGMDPSAHFQVYHPWSFLPTLGADTDTAMANLRERLGTGGWVLKAGYRDDSAHENLNLVADNDHRKVSVWAVAYSRHQPPAIGIEVRSGCYRVPEGWTVEHW